MSDAINRIVKEIRKSVAPKQKSPGYETTAKVVRVDDKTAWVHIEGGVPETPAIMAVDCKKDDVVRVKISNKKAIVAGNITAPPTDDASVKKLKQDIEEGSFEGKPGKDGKDGEDGHDGHDATDILKVVIQHCLANARAIPAGQTFEDIRYTPWSETIPEPVTGKYYWMRVVTYFVDGSVSYGDPLLDLETQTIYEANLVAANAQQAAEDAQAAAQDAADEAEAAADAAEQAAQDASSVEDQQKHFWYDSTTGAHVSEADGSIATGAAFNILSGVATVTRNGKLLSSFTNNALNFYDGTGSNPAVNDILASYNREGVTFYAKQLSTGKSIRTASITKGSLTFWDPTDSTSLLSNQRMRALFSNSSSNFYSGGKLVTSLGANSLNFYDGAGSATAANDLLAAYTRDGLILYGKASASAAALKIASFTRSAVTFWDPSDGQTAQAIFGSSGISFNNQIPFTIGNTGSGNPSYIRWYNKGTASNPNWVIDICAGTIRLGNSNVATEDMVEDVPALSQITQVAKAATWSMIQSWVGLVNDTWSGISSFDGTVGDTVLIAIQVTDKDNATGYMRCVVKGYSGTTLTTDNIDFMFGPTGPQGPEGPSSHYLASISDGGVFVHRYGSDYSDNPTSPGAYGVTINDQVGIIRNGVKVADFGANSSGWGYLGFYDSTKNVGALQYRYISNRNDVGLFTNYDSYKYCSMNVRSSGTTANDNAFVVTSSYGTTSSDRADTSIMMTYSDYMVARTHGGSSLTDYYMRLTNSKFSLGTTGEKFSVDCSTGDLKLGGHSTAVGSILTGSNTKNIATGTSYVTSGATISLPIGTWIVTYSATFEANSTGNRASRLSVGGSAYGVSEMKINAGGNAERVISGTACVAVTAASTAEVFVWQSSGGALSTTVNIRAIRIV